MIRDILRMGDALSAELNYQRSTLSLLPCRLLAWRSHPKGIAPTLAAPGGCCPLVPAGCPLSASLVAQGQVL